MSEGFRLRVKYQITDRLAYLSHLETVRSMERVVRRAGLPFAITEGFNPHMKIAFGPALPVGAGSRSDYFDLRLREYVSPILRSRHCKRLLRKTSCPLHAQYCAHGDDAIDVTYPVSVWKAELTCEGIDVDDVTSRVRATG